MHWLKRYRKELLAGDIGAGIIVALMLIPQGMAYALVAGLPPVTGLYASLLPAVAYALFGSSMVQSVGPMAITSLMVGTAIGALAPAGSALYAVLSQQLALLAGVVLFLCGVLRLGFLSNFFSRPVMSGFTSGAAVVMPSIFLCQKVPEDLRCVHLLASFVREPACVWVGDRCAS